MARKLNQKEESDFIEAIANPCPEHAQDPDSAFSKALSDRKDSQMRLGSELAAWFGVDLPPRPGSW